MNKRRKMMKNSMSHFSVSVKLSQRFKLFESSHEISSNFKGKMWLTSFKLLSTEHNARWKAYRIFNFHNFPSAPLRIIIYLFHIRFTWGGLLNAFTQFRYHYHPFLLHTKAFKKSIKDTNTTLSETQQFVIRGGLWKFIFG